MNIISYMVDAWGTGLSDFTNKAQLQGSASISGSIVSISGDLSIRGDFIYRPRTILVTAASGGQAIGSGLTISGYSLYNVVLKNPAVNTSGITRYGSYINSGDTAGVVWVGGGATGDYPHAGGGVISSGGGLMMAPGDERSFSVSLLERIYVAAETSGSPISVMLEMK